MGTEALRPDTFRSDKYRPEGVHTPPLVITTTKRSLPVSLMVGSLGILLLGGLGVFFLARRGAAPPTPPPATAEMRQALSRVQELEARLRTVEAEKAAAEARAAAEAKTRLEAQARQRGQMADPAAVRRAQEEAARAAREEQQARVAELARQLEQSQNEARAARQRQAETATTSPSAAAISTAAPLPVTVVTDIPSFVPLPPATPSDAPPSAASATPATPASVAVVLVPPTLQSAPRLTYPPLALRQRIEGTVVIRAFVNDQGIITERQMVQGVAGRSGLNEAALDNVRQRRYRPATQAGNPTGTWITIRVEFRLPR